MGMFYGSIRHTTSGRKRKAVLRALDQLSEQFNQTLQNLIDEKHPSTEVIPQQLHLPLGQNQSDIQDPWLKVSG